MEKLFRLARELAGPSAWSAGVELARNAEIQEYRPEVNGERFFRVVQGPRDPVVSVSLSESDEVWQCDCGSDDDPCRHVVASLIALRQGSVGKGALKRPNAIGVVKHEFRRERGYLSFSRVLSVGDNVYPVEASLRQAVAAIAARGERCACSDAEFALDHFLVGRKSGIFEPRVLQLLLSALSRVAVVELDSCPIAVSAEVIAPEIVVRDEGDGYRIRREVPGGITESFLNGIALRDGVLVAINDSGLTAEELSMLSGDGTFVPGPEGIGLASRIVPTLRGKMAVRIESARLPRARSIPPRILVETRSDDTADSLTVIPRLVYGTPAIAEVRGATLELVSPREVPIRNAVEESRLAREAEAKLRVRLGEARVLSGAAAVDFVTRLSGYEIYGSGAAAFAPREELRAVIDGDAAGLKVRFESSTGFSLALGDAMGAVRSGRPYARVPGIGWSILPVRFMETHRHVLEQILEASDGSSSIPRSPAASLLGEVEEMCGALSLPMPEYFSRLKRGLAEVSTIPDAPLPEGLTAKLRPYQRDGVNWLAFLRDYGLNGLLADDMGLGKTLQALCVARGRTLVVAPTSVLFSWQAQISAFRPGLSVALYQGPRRALTGADITIMSYAVLRLDIEQLESVTWDTIILDESQTIRNPDSQVARAAYRLRSESKISLSGTPIENTVGDLWGQFNFLQPGLLGSRTEFEQRFLNPIEAGDYERAKVLKRRVAPFILRRLKRDVARELPPKTEVVLECELSADERLAYDALLAATRDELQRAGERRGSPLTILEALLRVRQACCHRGLLPGLSAESSSKVDLLLESLRASCELGHRALVFSQWTSLLDLVEPHLTEAGLSFSRIDGSTADRESVVREFQRQDGPNVMLLSLKAGGLGLTLTAADHVYILDPWWNPAAEEQAADRAYRIGQENPVVVHRLVARDTIEERVLVLQERKRGLLRDAVGDRTEVSLSHTDIEELLS